MDSDTLAPTGALPARGRVLKEPGSDDGLISIGGQQHAFTLREHWRSDAPPRAGAWVAAELDADGRLLRVTLVNDAARAGALAGELAQDALARARADGLPLVRELLGRWRRAPGVPALVALGLVFLAWTCLDLIQVHAMGTLNVGVTLWQVLQLANGAGDPMAMLQAAGGGVHPGAGLYGLIAIAALALPLATPWIRHRAAPLLLCAPLAFMLLLLSKAWYAADSALSGAAASAQAVGGAEASALMAQMQRELMHQFWQALSLGTGLYLGLLAAVALAAIGVLHWRGRAL